MCCTTGHCSQDEQLCQVNEFTVSHQISWSETMWGERDHTRDSPAASSTHLCLGISPTWCLGETKLLCSQVKSSIDTGIMQTYESPTEESIFCCYISKLRIYGVHNLDSWIRDDAHTQQENAELKLPTQWIHRSEYARRQPHTSAGQGALARTHPVIYLSYFTYAACTQPQHLLQKNASAVCDCWMRSSRITTTSR